MFIFKVGMIRHFQFVHDCECMLLFKIYWSGIKNFYLIIILDFEGAGSEFKNKINTYSKRLFQNGDHVLFMIYLNSGKT